MSTYRELVYLILDELKGVSDDFSYTQDHIIFLLDKYRGFILKQRYSDIRKQIPESNYQTLCLDLIKVPAISDEVCGEGSYLRSKEKVPYIMNIGTPRVYPTDYYKGEITIISRDRMRYVGYNKYLQNIIYCSINPDSYLYFKYFFFLCFKKGFILKGFFIFIPEFKSPIPVNWCTDFNFITI